MRIQDTSIYDVVRKKDGDRTPVYVCRIDRVAHTVQTHPLSATYDFAQRSEPTHVDEFEHVPDDEKRTLFDERRKLGLSLHFDCQ